MSWLTGIRSKVSGVDKKDIPDNLWIKCTGCARVVFHTELESSLFVCPHCGCHMRISARQRVAQLADQGSWQELSLPLTVDDPLDFADTKPYKARLAEDRKATGNRDAFIAGTAKIRGVSVVLGVMDFTFRGGSLSTAVGGGIVHAASVAVSERLPLVLVMASGGARMQEGILSLMQMPRTIFALEEVKAARLPYIAVLADPTTGGVSASFAMLGDVHIAEPRAVIGFAGARVIEETIRQKLPAGFQRAESLVEHGMVDMVVERAKLPREIAKILAILTRDSEES
ncbi:acetyl-coenzyme A carboxylase carboxyl transferase subunit beta [Alphaproteobacteria bacterium]|nr:acetyl-coenzyme A carboxylase carboxyl transferase subunit beta [Alphaproteobacteria bacterium]